MAKKTAIMYSLITSLFLLVACNTATDSTTEGDWQPTPAQAKDYWYDGKAEISSYVLKQARYGEMREGTAVMIFVTEPFSKNSWTKADTPSDENISVMKLNFTKKFNTGIYPYSMMTSTFFPFEQEKHSVKISTSVQEWCGHTYMEMRNKSKFETRIDSYFEGEATDLKTDKNYLEDDFWTIIRINPKNLPTGEHQVIPSFFYQRLAHVEMKAQQCELLLDDKGPETTYSLFYPALDRTLTITYETDFPHKILSWKETYTSGYGDNRKELSTTGTLNESMRVDYWNKNSEKDSTYRTKLGLD